MFNRAPKESGVSFNPSERVSGGMAQNGPLTYVTPKGYGDVEYAIDNLKKGATVMVTLTGLKLSTKIRVIDLLSGAVYALGGGIMETSPNVYLISPTGINIK